MRNAGPKSGYENVRYSQTTLNLGPTALEKVRVLLLPGRRKTATQLTYLKSEWFSFFLSWLKQTGNIDGEEMECTVGLMRGDNPVSSSLQPEFVSLKGPF